MQSISARDIHVRLQWLSIAYFSPNRTLAWRIITECWPAVDNHTARLSSLFETNAQTQPIAASFDPLVRRLPTHVPLIRQHKAEHASYRVVLRRDTRTKVTLTGLPLSWRLISLPWLNQRHTRCHVADAKLPSSPSTTHPTHPTRKLPSIAMLLNLTTASRHLTLLRVHNTSSIASNQLHPTIQYPPPARIVLRLPIQRDRHHHGRAAQNTLLQQSSQMLVMR